jgi:hypothetical protein
MTDALQWLRRSALHDADADVSDSPPPTASACARGTVLDGCADHTTNRAPWLLQACKISKLFRFYQRAREPWGEAVARRCVPERYPPPPRLAIPTALLLEAADATSDAWSMIQAGACRAMREPCARSHDPQLRMILRMGRYASKSWTQSCRGANTRDFRLLGWRSMAPWIRGDARRHATKAHRGTTVNKRQVSSACSQVADPPLPYASHVIWRA